MKYKYIRYIISVLLTHDIAFFKIDVNLPTIKFKRQ
jgi:hypothetical protein